MTSPWSRGILLISMVILFADSSSAQQEFSIQPDASYDRFVGNSVLLLCSVTNKEGTLTWVKDSSTAISADRSIVASDTARYSISGDDASGSFNLLISDLVEDDSGSYECRVSASGASSAINSVAADLTVSAIPVQSFVTEPSDAQALTGNSVTLPCEVENKEGDLEWVKDGAVISNNSEITDVSLTRYSIVGASSDGEYNLQIVTLQQDDMGTYSCRVTAAGNSAAITSGNAVLTVRDASEVQSIVIPPSDVTATVGTPATLVCYVSALSGSVLWLKDGVQISRDRDLVNGDTSGRVSIIGSDADGEYNLYISKVEEDDQALYFCVLSQSETDSPVSSSPATLTVEAAVAPNEISPECSLTPSTILSENDIVTITCESSGGSPQPTLTWSNDLDANTFTGNQTEDESSATNSITFALTKDLSGVVYTCRSTHPAYSEPKECSLPALTFDLIATINVSTTLDVNRLIIEEDKQGEIVCIASGDPTVLGYRWYYNGAEIETTDDRFVVETTNAKDSSTLTLRSATLSMDDSTVQCEAYNRIDARRTSIVLTIKEDNLTTYVLAALGLIATIIFVAIVIGFIVWVCHRMNKKKRTIHPDPEAGDMMKPIPNKNFFIGATHMDGMQNGGIKTDAVDEKKKHKKDRKHKKDKKHKKDRKHKKDKSKVLEHDSSRVPNPLSTRDGDHDVLPTITGYRRPGTTSRDPGVYPTYPPMYPIDGHSPLPHYQDGYPQVDPNMGHRSSRRDSKDRSSTPNGKISLSPGEYQKRDEYERKLRELQGLRTDLVAAEPDKKKKKKHKKHKKDKS